VNVAYAVTGDTYTFKIENYDPSVELIIDPLLASTFIGEVDSRNPLMMTLDTSGNVYVAGTGILPVFPQPPVLMIERQTGQIFSSLKLTVGFKHYLHPHL
jgi:hypothetical protein